MADKRLLSKERLDDCRKSVSRINDGMTPDHRAFVRNLLGQDVPDLLVHIEAQAKQIAELQAALKVTWVPSKEGIPSEFQHVWIKVRGITSRVTEGYWKWRPSSPSRRRKVWLEHGSNWLHRPLVTHWAEMHLPEPPQKERGGNE